MNRTPAALSIAGSDSCAGAGLQADLKTFSALGVYGATVVTAITAQNTLGVSAVHLAPPDIIAAQIDAVFSDLAIAAVKTGMLGGEDAIEAVAAGLERWARGIPVVVDPVMISTTGSRLLEKGAERALAERLFPLASPDYAQPSRSGGASRYAGGAEPESEVEDQAQRLLAFGPSAALIKGGHGAGARRDRHSLRRRRLSRLLRAEDRHEEHARNGLHARVGDRRLSCEGVSRLRARSPKPRLICMRRSSTRANSTSARAPGLFPISIAGAKTFSFAFAEKELSRANLSLNCRAKPSMVEKRIKPNMSSPRRSPF